MRYTPLFQISCCHTSYYQPSNTLCSIQVEFNKAAQSLTDAIIPPAQKKLALTRLIKAQLILR
jgi:hypothetical protein